MHRRVLKSLVPLLGAAALVAAPIALAAPASAAPVVAAVIDPDETVPFDEDLNHPEYWEDYFAEEEGFEVFCAKDEPIDTPYTIPAMEELFDLEQGESYDDYFYVLAVLKGGADEFANELYWVPSEGDELAHSHADNSHVILCIGALDDEPSSPPSPTKPPHPKPTHPKPTVTGPVVETDRVADSGSSAGLGLAAAAIVLGAGVGGVFVSRRRQGAHR